MKKHIKITKISEVLKGAGIEVVKVDENFALIVGRSGVQRGLDFFPFRFGLLVCDDSNSLLYKSRSGNGVYANSGWHPYACSCCTFHREPENLETLLSNLKKVVAEKEIHVVAMRLPDDQWRKALGVEMWEIKRTQFAGLRLGME